MIERAAAEHYTWGAGCDGWHLVRRSEISVIQERMPPGTGEVRHYHVHAWQFFFVLRGVAIMEMAGDEVTLTAEQGLEMPPGVPHRIRNDSAADVEFLVISRPPSHGDRVIS